MYVFDTIQRELNDRPMDLHHETFGTIKTIT